MDTEKFRLTKFGIRTILLLSHVMKEFLGSYGKSVFLMHGVGYMTCVNKAVDITLLPLVCAHPAVVSINVTAARTRFSIFTVVRWLMISLRHDEIYFLLPYEKLHQRRNDFIGVC